MVDQSESIYQFSKHSDYFHKKYNVEFHSVKMASDGLVLMLQFKTIEKISLYKGLNSLKLLEN